MRPSRLLALGPLLVPFNFYLGRFDLLPNPLGWLGGARATADGCSAPVAHAAMWSSVFGLVLSMVTTLASWTGPQAGLGPLPMIEVLLPVLVVVLVCSALIALAGTHDPSTTKQANVIRPIAPVFALVTIVLAGASVNSSGLTVIDETVGPAIALLIFAVGGLAVHVWFLILLMTHGQTLDTEPARSDSVD